MTPEKDLTSVEEWQLSRVLDAWQVASPRPGLGFAIIAAARPRTPGFSWTWPRLVTLAAAACLGLMVGWADGPGDSYANQIDPSADTLFFPADTADGDVS